MITDRKLHQRIANESIVDSHIIATSKYKNVCWNDPTIVIKTEEGYISSKISYKTYPLNKFESEYISHYKKTFDFFLKIPYYTLQQRDVCKLSVLLPKSKESDIYMPVYTQNAIFQIEDLKDAVFIFYKDVELLETLDFRTMDAYIYCAGVQKYVIDNIYGEIDIRDGFDINLIRFKRWETVKTEEYPDNWLLIKGQEIAEKQMDISFIQWEQLFGYHRNSFYQLSQMYDKTNVVAVNSSRLKWDSKEIVQWKCVFGHEWKESIYNYTHPKYPKQFCPECQAKIKGLGFFDNDEIIKRNIEKIMYVMDYYKIYDLDDLLNIIDLDLVNLESIILHSDDDIPWINKLELPKTVDFYFAYPDGKRGDISRVIDGVK